MTRHFLVARNPDADSTWPYLLAVPAGAGLVLKAHDSWPRTSRFYCHRIDSWPEDAEIIKDVPVIACRPRGVAVDLLLDRPRESRSHPKASHAPNGTLPDLLARDPVRCPEIPSSARRRGLWLRSGCTAGFGAGLADSAVVADSFGVTGLE